MSKMVIPDNELGYNEDGPTTAQTQLQDAIDNKITEFFEGMIELYRQYSGKEIKKFEHDIGRITAIREETEEQLELPDIY